MISKKENLEAMVRGNHSFAQNVVKSMRCSWERNNIRARETVKGGVVHLALRQNCDKKRLCAKAGAKIAIWFGKAS